MSAKTYPDVGTLANGLKYQKWPEAVCLDLNKPTIIELHDTFRIYKDRWLVIDVWFLPFLKRTTRKVYKSIIFVDPDMFLSEMEKIPASMVPSITV